MLAIGERHIPVVKSLLAARADPRLSTHEGWTALMAAASSPGFCSRFLLSSLFPLLSLEDVNAQDDRGHTAIFQAVMSGKTYAVKALVGHGANINLRNKSGWTVLMGAAQEGHTEIVKVLLAAGAEVNASNSFGRTSLMWAADRGRSDCCEILLQAGADVSRVDEDGWSVENSKYVGIQRLLAPFLGRAPTPDLVESWYAGGGAANAPTPP